MTARAKAAVFMFGIVCLAGWPASDKNEWMVPGALGEEERERQETQFGRQGWFISHQSQGEWVARREPRQTPGTVGIILGGEVDNETGARRATGKGDLSG